MKPLAVWAAAVTLAFAGLAGVTSATRGTDQVLVVVDSSFFMEDVWNRVPGEVRRIESRENAEFALVTVSDRVNELVHGYQSDIDSISNDPFGPCSFDQIDNSDEAASADERILITSSESCVTSELDGWTVIELDR